MPFTRHDPVDYDGLPLAYDTYDLWDQGGGIIVVEWYTNDDGDTGYPGTSASETWSVKSIRKAFKLTGITRHGVGHEVFVSYEGEEVLTADDMVRAIQRSEARIHDVPTLRVLRTPRARP